MRNEIFRPGLVGEVIFMPKSWRNWGEIKAVVNQGEDVPHPQPEPLHTTNPTSEMNFFGLVYHVKWLSRQLVENPRELEH